MPALRDVVDIEATLVAYLKADAAVAALVGTRVSTELPAGFTAEARVRLFRVGGAPSPDDPAGYLDRPSVQFDCYGATREQAWDVAAATLRAALEAPAATHTGVVITGTRRTLGPTWQPDPDTDIPRYLLTAVLWTHPTGS